MYFMKTTGLAKKIAQSAITFFLHRDNNFKFLPFFYNDILRSCLKFYNEIPRSYKMTSIFQDCNLFSQSAFKGFFAGNVTFL